MPNNYLPPILSFLENMNSIPQLAAKWRNFASGIPMYINGNLSASNTIHLSEHGHLSSNKFLYLYMHQGVSDKLYPSGTSVTSGIWLNSDNNTTDMWSYVDEDPYTSLEDSSYITTYQSGQTVSPNNLYWVAESGIIKYNLSSNIVTKIMDGNADTQLSTHISYNDVDGYVYYGVENGNTGYTKRVDDLGLRKATISSNFGAGIAHSNISNTIYGMNKDGNFKTLTDERYEISRTSLLGKETLNRRVRINTETDDVYALQTEDTSYLTKLYQYDPSTGLWNYKRILTYGMFGGAFDIDYASGNIYYTATTDYFTANYYGIVKESISGGSGVRIVTPNSPSYFQTKELLFNKSNRQLYYVGEDVSGANKSYNLIKTDDNGGSATTLLSMPEHSGIKAMAFDGGLYRSYIDFDITDLSSTFADYTLSSTSIQSAYLSIKAKNYNDFSYIRPYILNSTKTDYIWRPTYSNATKLFSSGAAFTYNIGNGDSSVNSAYNTPTAWNNGVLRLEVAASSSGNSDITRIYSTNVTLIGTTAAGTPVASSIPMYIESHAPVTNSIPLNMLSDAKAAELPMYIYSTIHNSGDFTGYLYGQDSSSGLVPMYIFGKLPSLDMPMYSEGHISIDSSFGMYTSGLGTEIGAMPLYLAVDNWVQASSTIPLYINSSAAPSVVKAVDMFITTSASVNPASYMNLYIDGFGGIPRSSSMNLYLRSETPSLSQGFDMTVGNYYGGLSNTIELHTTGPEGIDGTMVCSGTINLYLSLVENEFKAVPMYLKAVEQSINSIPMMLEGQPKSFDTFSLYTSGLLPETKTTTLYTHGF